MTADNTQLPLVITIVGDAAESRADAIQDSIYHAARLSMDQFIAASHMPGRQIVVERQSGFGSPESAVKAAEAIVSQNRTGMVLGVLSQPVLQVVGPVFKQARIPVVSFSSEHLTDAEEQNWLYRMVPTVENQAQFLANYTRNVIGEKIVTIIHNDTAYGMASLENFEKIYTLFGTKIHKKLLLPSKSKDVNQLLDQMAKEIKESQDGSAIFLALSPYEAALFVKKARDRKVRNVIVGSDMLATHAFRQILQSIPGSLPMTEDYTNQLLISTPFLFDTANEFAQRFKNQFARIYGNNAPDWMAAYAYETVQGVLHMLAESWSPKVNIQVESDRNKIVTLLSSVFSLSYGQSIVDGQLFGGQGKHSKPILMGRYNGAYLVAALTQLHPISESIQRSGSTNYLEELQQGRMLFVNDRFMYKTNVVYTGMDVTEITDLDVTANKFTMEFFLWFRYRGSFNPEAIEFNNAIEPIELKEPLESLVKEDISFKLFKVKGQFSLDHLDTRHPFGSHIIGTAFRHKTLNRNNLLFVADVLGMGMESGKTLFEMVSSPQVMSANLGWKTDQAWLAQQRVLISSLGKPTYVGYGTADPEFSRIDLGIVISKGEFSARDYIPYEYFIYIGIFGLIGLIFALGIDINTQGTFWKVASWGLRVLFWPIFLISFGNLFLDYAFQNLPPHFITYFLLGYKMLWWVIPAMLVTMALERFLWEPLENRANQKIPNVIRNIVAFLVYILAGFGITAFVFDEKLTSLLATSGLITMIIGLAVQSNIANIFSGIAVNLERPFTIGDWLKIGTHPDAQLIDITWRTMRLRTVNGLTLSLPNAKATEMLVVNYSANARERCGIPVYVAASHDPNRIKALLLRAMSQCDALVPDVSDAEFHGIVNMYSQWVAKYEAEFFITDHGQLKETLAELHELIWKTFKESGVPCVPARHHMIDPAVFQALSAQEEQGDEEEDEEEEDDKQDDTDLTEESDDKETADGP